LHRLPRLFMVSVDVVPALMPLASKSLVILGA
jgi:hypothetical protein